MGEFGSAGAMAFDGDYTEEEQAQMAQVAVAQEELRRKLYEKQLEEQS